VCVSRGLLSWSHRWLTVGADGRLGPRGDSGRAGFAGLKGDTGFPGPKGQPGRVGDSGTSGQAVSGLDRAKVKLNLG
jgi:hypothetical protein